MYCTDAWPLASVTADAWERVPPLGSETRLNVTVAPETGLPFASVTVASNCACCDVVPAAFGPIAVGDT